MNIWFILIFRNSAAVQHERDKISNRRAFYESAGINGTLIDISCLLRAEVESKEASGRCELFDVVNNGSLCLSDICAAMKYHLFRLINWAKQLDCFACLEMQDQVGIYKLHFYWIFISSKEFLFSSVNSTKGERCGITASLYCMACHMYLASTPRTNANSALNEYPAVNTSITDSLSFSERGPIQLW